MYAIGYRNTNITLCVICTNYTLSMLCAIVSFKHLDWSVIIHTVHV